MDILNSKKMQELVTIVEEATRSSKEGVRNFVEPAQGTLSRVVSKRHHVVFGRRGSGKSSLLEKAAAELTIDRRPIAKVDLEAFKGHTYPDVLLSVLIRTLSEFKRWLDTAAINPATKTSFWKRLFGTAPKRASFNRAGTKSLSNLLDAKIKQLTELLDAADAAAMSVTSTNEHSASSEAMVSATIPIGASIGGSLTSGINEKASQQVNETYSRSKTDFLHRHILEYQNIFRQMAELSGGDCFLLLDDLYHIRRADQASVIDYFHRIAKGNNLWLKVGTIRHRTDWYRHGNRHQKMHPSNNL
jgi:hypothetical protein